MSADLWYAEAIEHKRRGDECAARGHWRGAYGHYGTATEFVLKAIYLKNSQSRQMPDHLKSAKSHDINYMAMEAGLGQEIATFKGAKLANWLTVRDWDQGKRYPNEPFPAIEGKDLKTALLNPSNGIWQWLLNHYHST